MKRRLARVAASTALAVCGALLVVSPAEANCWGSIGGPMIGGTGECQLILFKSLGIIGSIGGGVTTSIPNPGINGSASGIVNPPG